MHEPLANPLIAAASRLRRTSTLSIGMALLCLLAACLPGHVARNQPPLTFAFCSDIHCTDDFCGNFNDATVAQFRAELGPCDFVVLGGDLTHNGADPAFSGLKKRLETLGKPFYSLPGNHDVGQGSSAYERYFGNRNPCTFQQQKGVGLLFLDLCDNGMASVGADSIFIARLRTVCSQIPSTLPLIVFSHFPLHPSSPRYAVKGSERIFSLLDRKRVIGYFSGHYHGWLKLDRRGVPFYSAGTLLPGVGNHDGTAAHGFYKITATKDSLTVRFVQLN